MQSSFGGVTWAVELARYAVERFGEVLEEPAASRSASAFAPRAQPKLKLAWLPVLLLAAAGQVTIGTVLYSRSKWL
jgi:hypothetical protein